MKLQARFLLLFLFLFAAVASLLVLQRAFDLDRSHYILQAELKQRQNYFQKITQIEGQPLESLSVDYSFWDDMVAFVHKPTTKFATDNIDTGLDTFDADVAWVYRPDRSIAYFKAADGNPALRELSLPASFFEQLYESHFEHFFVQRGADLIELRAASIHPGNDISRLSPPAGFWIVGRLWDQEIIDNLGDLTQSTLRLQPPTADSSDKLNTDSISFSHPLRSWDGQALAYITSTAQVPVVGDLRGLYNRQLLLLIAFTLISALVVALFIWLFILKPMRLIARSIEEQKPTLLNKMAHKPTEFGRLAHTVQQFYRQKVTIEESDFLKNKLIELNKAKGEFLAIAAHELKGPVGNIHIFTQNLTELLHTSTSRKQLVIETQRIGQQAHKATVLINDMYQASKGGQFLELKHTEFDFDAFIKQEVDNAQYSTAQHLELHGTTHRLIVSDTNRLSQVMANLIRNAAKYSLPSATIQIVLKHTSSQVTVQVVDTGIGISRSDQARVFERFYRSSKVATSYPGLGLGLSVCKEIIESLGGKIGFDSQEGKGSCFYFSLPADTHAGEQS